MDGDPTYTFLFTDIERSSTLWDRAPELMEPAVARHDELLVAAVLGCDGRVVKSTGDGIHACFDAAADGVKAAVDAMVAIESEPWHPTAPIRVRMGLHTGTASPRAGDYFGPVVNRAARLEAAAHPGQIVVSAAVVDASGRHLGPEVGFLDLGLVHLRSLIEPESIFQVTASGLHASFPPIGISAPNNLPAYGSSFVGRDAELMEVDELLLDHRLVTLHGAGGAGKTRLAVEVANRVLPRFGDGIWMIELASLESDGSVSGAIATTLGVAESGTGAREAILGRLAGEAPMLVLDNCEHVVDEAASLVASLRAAAPQLTVLATSQVPLGVEGETVYSLHPLSTVGERGSSAAERLFLDRAKVAKPGFDPSEADLASIARLTADLDGLPLAIELAAVRMRMLTPGQILDRLADRFALLTAGPRTADRRQQTLRATLDWSYELLEPERRQALDLLSVFAGSFTEEAASAVFDPETPSFEVLADLVDHGLLATVAASDELRFEMTSTVRAYASVRLDQAGDRQGAMARHAGYFLERVADADSLLRGPLQTTWQRRLEMDHPDVLHAIDHWIEHDPDGALTIGAAIGRLWYRQGAVSIALDVLARVAAAATSPSIARARVLGWLGFFHDVAGDRAKARAMTNESLRLATETGDPDAMAFALNGLGGYAADDGDPRSAAEHWRGSIAALDRAERPWVAAPLFNLGWVLVELGELDEARTVVERLARIGADQSDASTAAMSNLLSGYVLHGSNELTDAASVAQVALESFEAHGDIFHAAEACLLLSSIAELAGDVERARSEFDRARTAMAETGSFDDAAAKLLEARISLRGGDATGAQAALVDAAIDAQDVDNPTLQISFLHEVARLASALEDGATALSLLDASRRARQSADLWPKAFEVHEAEEIKTAAGDLVGAGRAEPAYTVSDAASWLSRFDQ